MENPSANPKLATLEAVAKAAAASHRHSLNSEAIVCLESALLPGRVTLGDRLARARALRAALPRDAVPAADIDALEREGRR